VPGRCSEQRLRELEGERRRLAHELRVVVRAERAAAGTDHIGNLTRHVSPGRAGDGEQERQRQHRGPGERPPARRDVAYRVIHVHLPLSVHLAASEGRVDGTAVGFFDRTDFLGKTVGCQGSSASASAQDGRCCRSAGLLFSVFFSFGQEKPPGGSVSFQSPDLETDERRALRPVL